MPNLPALLHDGVLTAGAVSILYAATVTATVLTAILAHSPSRRRDARAVLKILLRRRHDRL